VLRWFTPNVEVDLCGHATLASAHVVFSFLEPERESVRFRTLKAGTLVVRRGPGMLTMDFPARPAAPCDAPAGLLAALGGKPSEVLRARDHLVVYDSVAEIAALKPDLAALAKVDCWAAIVTAPGEDGVDFVSRFFAPAKGVPEDPVTGSAHTTLVPYWAKRLGKTTLKAGQLSRRGGLLCCALHGERVDISGHAVTFLVGHIEL
jgi:predicted PhzF superfamily epimerase YddE/YHI9